MHQLWEHFQKVGDVFSSYSSQIITWLDNQETSPSA